MSQELIERSDASPFDAAKAEAFAERLMNALNEAATMLMTSIGHRVGLFDALDGSGALTSADLARRAGLNERYVREWLAVMTTARIVVYDPASKTYRLPAEHAAFLTRAATPNNLAAIAQYIPVLASVETPLIDCFRNGGGLTYEQYHRFHEVMAEDSAQTVLAALFDHILPLAPEIMARLEQGIDALDVGCGAGRALVAMAERYPNSRFVGYDLSEEALAVGRAEAASKGLGNVRFEARDLSTAPPEGQYDLITAFDAVHDQRDPQGLLDSVARALRPDGVFLMQDIGGSSRLEENMDHPLGPLLYTASTGHCMSVSLGQGGPGLGTMWGADTAERMLAAAGFGKIAKHALAHDPQNVYFVARK